MATVMDSGVPADKSAPSLALAARSDMFLKLYVNNGCDTGGIDIKLIDLLLERETGYYNFLRHNALGALFKYSPSGKVPQYAYKNFDTHFHCKIDAKEIRIYNDEQLIQVLEHACTENLMDDNNGVILSINCTFVNTFEFEEVKKIRASATAAADAAFKTMRSWIEKVAEALEKRKALNKDEDEYVVVSDGKKKRDNPVQWAHRFVSLLFRPEKKNEFEGMKNDRLDQFEEALDHFSLAIVEGFARASDIVAEVIARQEDAAFQAFLHSRRVKKKSRKFQSSVTSTTPKNESMVEEDSDLDKGVEVVFDPSDGNVSEEWKIFFNGKNSEESEESNEIIFVETPVAADVISIDSDDIEDDSLRCGGESDEESWTMLDD